jgi:hypothetical protein
MAVWLQWTVRAALGLGDVVVMVLIFRSRRWYWIAPIILGVTVAIVTRAWTFSR